MYIPLLANQVLNNIDKIVEGRNLAFKGILIGNGVMLTESHWRRQARNTFFSRHYFYGPEIQGLISKCKYDSSDDNNPSCTMGNKLADEVSFILFRPPDASILTTALASAMLLSHLPAASLAEGTGTAPSMRNFTIRWRLSPAAVQIKMAFLSSSTTRKSRDSSTCQRCCGRAAVTKLGPLLRRTPALWVFLRVSRMQALKSCFSLATSMPRCHTLKPKSTSEELDGSRHLKNSRF
jgi:hypothetical protein